MIGVQSKLTGNVIDDLSKFEAKIKESVILSGAAAAAKVIYDEVRSNAARHKQTGVMLEAVYRVYAKDHSSEFVKTYHIAVSNKKAFYWRFLEYGTSRQPPRAFIRPAFDHIREAFAAGKARMKELLAGG